MMYNEQLLTYLHKATAKPLWPESTAGVFSAEVGVPESGAWIKLWVYIPTAFQDINLIVGADPRVRPENSLKNEEDIKNKVIQEIRYRVIGGGYLIATIEWANEFLTGKSLSTAEALNAKLIVEALNLPPQRFYCAQMVVDAVMIIMRQAI